MVRLGFTTTNMRVTHNDVRRVHETKIFLRDDGKREP
jgi:hypothetical protein